MRILAIETSCDETASAIVEMSHYAKATRDERIQILSNIVASSQEIHQKYGGIIPEVAAREQVKSMMPVIEESLQQAKLESGDLDAIAVTQGPGLIGSLLIGVETAKSLAYVWKKPLIPINHLVGHIYANWLDESVPQLPAVVLIVSGGHTELVLMKSHGKFEWIGGTRDDAAGECFDKAARLLELGYPGGPAIAAAAAQFKIPNFKFEIKLPRPMLEEKNFDFSFSGLKTAVLREVNQLKNNQQFSALAIQQLAFETQEAATDVLVAKTLGAAKRYQIKSVLLSGGVAANQRLREKMGLAVQQFSSSAVQLSVPEPKFCTDNAAMIGAAACFNYSPVPWQKIEALPGLDLTGAV